MTPQPSFSEAPARRRDHRRVGNTLAELLVVVAILGALVAAAAPRYVDSLMRYRVDTAARQVAADVAFVQRQAIVQGNVQTMVFSGNTYSMPNARYLKRANVGATVNLADDPWRASISSVSFGGTGTLTFNRFGAPTAGGTVVVSVGSLSRTINIDGQTGRATIP